MNAQRVRGSRAELVRYRTGGAEVPLESDVRAAASAAGLGEYRFTVRPAGWRTGTALAAGAVVSLGAVLAWAEASWVLRLILAWVLVGALICAVAAMASFDRRTWHFFENGAVMTRGRKMEVHRNQAAGEVGRSRLSA